MKTTYHNIPALPFAADADVEALRRQLEGGSLEANEDGTVSTKDSKVTKPTIAQSKANATKKAGRRARRCAGCRKPARHSCTG